MIEMLFTLILIGFLVACLELTFQMYMQPNMILYPYGVLLMKLSQKGEVMRHLMRPLGRCRYCNATWIAFYVYVYFYGYDLSVLLLVGITTLFVKILSDHSPFKDVDANGKIEALYGVAITGNTPPGSMLWAYLILAIFYANIYITIPLLIQ